jgi:hypothetical protein
MVARSSGPSRLASAAGSWAGRFAGNNPISDLEFLIGRGALDQ